MVTRSVMGSARLGARGRRSALAGPSTIGLCRDLGAFAFALTTPRIGSGHVCLRASAMRINLLTGVSRCWCETGTERLRVGPDLPPLELTSAQLAHNVSHSRGIAATQVLIGRATEIRGIDIPPIVRLKERTLVWGTTGYWSRSRLTPIVLPKMFALSSLLGWVTFTFARHHVNVWAIKSRACVLQRKQRKQRLERTSSYR